MNGMEKPQEYRGPESDPWRYFRIGDSFAVLDTRNPEAGIRYVKPGSTAYAAIEKQLSDGTLEAVGKVVPSGGYDEPGIRDEKPSEEPKGEPKGEPVASESMSSKVKKLVVDRLPLIGPMSKMADKAIDMAKEMTKEPPPKIAPGTGPAPTQKMSEKASDVAKKKMEEQQAADETERKLRERSAAQERAFSEGGTVRLDIVAIPGSWK